MKFGVLKDIKVGEYRVIATPAEVSMIASDGHEVYVQRGAGEGSGFSDEAYAAEGAKLVDTKEEIYGECDFVAKVKEFEPSEYGLPYGRLYLAYSDKEPAGCIGLKRIDNKNCEVKRLYVRPAFRGRHIGRLLMEQIIREAKEIGYSHMLLDTLPFLQSAIHMYKKQGFYEISGYNNSPMDTSIYMKLDL